MAIYSKKPRVLGIDGCRGGWLGVARDAGTGRNAEVLRFDTFNDVLTHEDDFAVVAIDMPIGLPAFISGNGRGPEEVVRPLLGKRRASVFSIPSREAVYQETYEAACDSAARTSEPSKKISKQSFFLFPKIREIDAMIMPALQARIFEVHPELAYWRMNGEEPLSHAKKVRGRVNQAGMLERKALLAQNGFTPSFLALPPPKGAGLDDVLDASACCVIAERLLQGKAEPFPYHIIRDERGLRIAIWA